MPLKFCSMSRRSVGADNFIGLAIRQSSNFSSLKEEGRSLFFPDHHRGI